MFGHGAVVEQVVVVLVGVDLLLVISLMVDLLVTMISHSLPFFAVNKYQLDTHIGEQRYFHRLFDETLLPLI